MEGLEEYVKGLVALISDEDKMITYTRVAKERRVHVSHARQILRHMYDKYRQTYNMECCYLVMGTLKDGGMSLEVVRESNLSQTKLKYCDINSDRIYSVQKSLDETQLRQVNGDIFFNIWEKLDNNDIAEEDVIMYQGGVFDKYMERVRQKLLEYEKKTVGIHKLETRVRLIEDTESSTSSVECLD